jgi:transposase
MKKEYEPHDWKEGRRLRAWDLWQQGWKQKDIAAALGVSKGAVSQWLKRAKVEGREGLRRHLAPGPQPQLTAEQLGQLPQLLNQGAEAFGFRGEVWTTARVAAVIKRTFGVSYHPAHCSRLLQAINYSVQKPAQRASQRNEAAIKRWKDERWPALKKRPKKRNEPSSL